MLRQHNLPLQRNYHGKYEKVLQKNIVGEKLLNRNLICHSKAGENVTILINRFWEEEKYYIPNLGMNGNDCFTSEVTSQR